MKQFLSKGISRLITGIFVVPVFLILSAFISFTSAFAIDTNSSTPSSEINVDLVNGIAVRILDASAQQEINNVNLDLTAVPGGSFTSGKFNVEVSTSNKTGYKLYMESSYDQSSITGSATPSYTTNLVNQVNTSYAIPTLTNNVSLAEFQAGSNNSSNKWGYSLDDASFSPIPVHNAPAEVDSSSTPTASGLTPVTIGTNVNMDMASGTYKNQLTFTAIAEQIPIGYTLAYDANGGVGAPASQSSTTTSGSASFTISNTKPTRKNFIFIGWADSASATTAAYQPGDNITITPEGWDDTTKTLYAVWQATPFWTITYMQEMTPEICDSLYTPSNATGSAVTLVDNASAYSVVTSDNQPYVAQRTLYDIRDNNSYTIRKLADGNCWMTENLALGSTEQSYTLTSADTNLPDGETFILPVASAYNSTDWAPGTYDDPSATVRVGDSSVSGFGNWYSWWTAVAGTHSLETSSTGVASGSICPKNWILPGAYEHNTDVPYFRQLFVAYDLPVGTPSSVPQDIIDIWTGTPLDIVFTGEVTKDPGQWEITNSGSVTLWANEKSVSNWGKRMYVLGPDFAVDPLKTNPSGNRNVMVGAQVRCVASRS